MIQRVRGCVVIVGLVLSTVCACSGGNVTSAHEARLRSMPEPTSSAGPHCGVNLGYVPSGLRFLSAEGSPAQNEVNLRYIDETKAATSGPRAPWLLVHVQWARVQPLHEVSKFYRKTTRTSVRGKPALVIYDGAPRTDLYWNESSDVAADVDSTLGLAEVRRVAESLSIPPAAPADLPGPPEADPVGCASHN